jgi:alkanesulfonate monooxygenase SsuD/methylene tetrahydromethanopterin reductase-like flavin-dependent oxidoreductase (luciferase family)
MSPRQLVDLACASEDDGLAGVACGELASTEAMALLGAISEATTRVRISSSVVSVLSRSPALLAMAAVTLANLSDGRFTLGVGAGSPVVGAFHGRTLSRPVASMEGTISDIRAALSGKRLDEYGGFQLRGIAAAQVPLLISAMGTEMLKLAGRRADGVVCNFAGPEQIRRMSGIALEARAQAGCVEPFEVLTTLWVDAEPDEEESRRRFAIELAPYLAVPTYRDAAIALSNTDSIDRVASAWKQGGREAAARVFPSELTDALLLSGTKGHIADRLDAFAAAGCTGLRCTPLTQPNDPFAAAKRATSLLGSILADLG